MGEDMTDTAADTAPDNAPDNPPDNLPDNLPANAPGFSSSVSAAVSNPPGRKLPGWQKRLTDFLRANHAQPFQPGRWDCAIWAAGAVEAMTARTISVASAATAPSPRASDASPPKGTTITSPMSRASFRRSPLPSRSRATSP